MTGAFSRMFNDDFHDDSKMKLKAKGKYGEVIVDSDRVEARGGVNGQTAGYDSETGDLTLQGKVGSAKLKGDPDLGSVTVGVPIPVKGLEVHPSVTINKMSNSTDPVLSGHVNIDVSTTGHVIDLQGHYEKPFTFDNPLRSFETNTSLGNAISNLKTKSMDACRPDC